MLSFKAQVDNSSYIGRARPLKLGLINAPDKISNCSPHQKCRYCSAISYFFLDTEAGKHSALLSPVKHDPVQFPSLLSEGKSFSTVILRWQFTMTCRSKMIFKKVESPSNLMDSLFSQNAVIWCRGSVVLKMYLTVCGHGLPSSANHSYSRMVPSSLITIFVGLSVGHFNSESWRWSKMNTSTRLRKGSRWYGWGEGELKELEHEKYWG